MSTVIQWIAGILSGTAGALGIGGGGVLILYLVLLADVDQVRAQGINLLFFLPCGLIAIIIHAVKKRIKWKLVLPCVAGGLAGVFAGMWVLKSIDAGWLSKIFAAGLILLGLKELFKKDKKQNNTP